MSLDWLKKKYKQKIGNAKIPIEEIAPLANLEYDTYVQLIDLNYNNPDNLMGIANDIGLNKDLTEAEKDTLWKYIDDYLLKSWV